MSLAQEGDLVLLVSPDRKHYLIRLKAGNMWSSHKGNIHHNDIIGKALGRTLYTHSGAGYLALEPSTHDLIHEVPRGFTDHLQQGRGPDRAAAEPVPGADDCRGGHGQRGPDARIGARGHADRPGL